MIRMRAAVAVLSVLSVLTLAACAPGAPSPTPSGSTGSPSSEPSSEPTGSPGGRPAPRFGDGCAALLPASLVAQLTAVPLTAHDLLATELAGARGVPRHAAIAQAGGLLCEWSNGADYSSQTGSSIFRGIQLSVLPDAADGWTRMVDYYGFSADTGQVYCSSGHCGFDVFADGYWFSAEILLEPGESPLAATEAIVAHLRSAAAGFGDPSPASTVLRALPADCTATLPESLVAEVYGSGHALGPSDGGGGWSLWAEAMMRNGDLPGCGWYAEGPEAMFVSTLNGGAWLAPDVAEAGSPLSVTGLGAGDSAVLECADGACQVILAVRGHLVVGMLDAAPDPESGARRLAEHLVALVG